MARQRRTLSGRIAYLHGFDALDIPCSLRPAVRAGRGEVFIVLQLVKRADWWDGRMGRRRTYHIAEKGERPDLMFQYTMLVFLLQYHCLEKCWLTY